MTDCWRQHSIIYRAFSPVQLAQAPKGWLHQGWPPLPDSRWSTGDHTALLSSVPPKAVPGCTEKEQLKGSPNAPREAGQWCLTGAGRDALSHPHCCNPQPWEQDRLGCSSYTSCSCESWAAHSKVTKWTQHCQPAVTSDRGLTRFRHPLTKARTDFYKKPIKGLSQCRRGREGWSYRQGTAELSFR